MSVVNGGSFRHVKVKPAAYNQVRPPRRAWEWRGQEEEEEEEEGGPFRGWWVSAAVGPSTQKSLQSQALRESWAEPPSAPTPSFPVPVAAGSSGSAPWSPRASSSSVAEETSPTSSLAGGNWESDSVQKREKENGLSSGHVWSYFVRMCSIYCSLNCKYLRDEYYDVYFFLYNKDQNQ